MSKTSKVQVPPHGTNPSNEQQSPPFQIHWPDPDIKDSAEIQRPGDIVAQFKGSCEPFTLQKFLLDHLVDLVSKNHFEGYTDLGLSDFTYNYTVISETIFELEKHTADRNIVWSIKMFLKEVQRKDEGALNEASATIDSIVEKYESLSNGLNHFAEQYRRNLTKAKEGS